MRNSDVLPGFAKRFFSTVLHYNHTHPKHRFTRVPVKTFWTLGGAFLCHLGIAQTTAEVITTISALRAGSTAFAQVYVSSYSSNLGVGGGPFVYASADSDSSDNNCTIIIDHAGHRYHRQFNGPLPIEDCGADPTGVNDATVAIQSAFKVAVASNVPVSAGVGQFLVSSTLYPTGGSGVSNFYAPSLLCAPSDASFASGGTVFVASKLGAYPFIKYIGGSGNNSNAVVSGCGFSSSMVVTNQVGVEVQDMDGVALESVSGSNLWALMRAHNLSGFSEHDVARNSTCQQCTYLYHYQNDAGSSDSFRGSGFVNAYSNTGGILLTDSDNGKARIYNAPWDGDFGGSGPLFTSDGTTVGIETTGTLRLELVANSQMVSGPTVVFHRGAVMSNTAINNDNGQLRPDNWNINYGTSRYDGFNGLTATNPQSFRSNWNSDYTSGTAIVPLAGPFEDLFVWVSSPNYSYYAQISVIVSLYSSNQGQAAIINSWMENNGTGWGAPVVTFNNGGITLTNVNYTAANKITVTASHRGFAWTGIPWTQH